MSTITYACENCGKRQEQPPFFYWFSDTCRKCRKMTRWFPWALFQKARAEREARKQAPRIVAKPPALAAPYQKKRPWWAFWRKT